MFISARATPTTWRQLAEDLAEAATQAPAAEMPPQVRDLLEDAHRRVRILLEATQHYGSSAGAAAAGLDTTRGWRGDAETSARLFRERLEAALRVAALERHFSSPWPAEARVVLPTAAATPAEVAVWGTIVAWCALEALGGMLDPEEAEHSAAQLFDAMRLREPMAESFEALGLKGEERWQAAARVRASLAHASWAPGAEAAPGRSTAPLSWEHDADVAWLIGVHEYDGVRYFVKEPFERLLWWMALRALLRAAAKPRPDLEQLRRLEHELASRVGAAADGGYRVEALFEPDRP